MLEMNRGFRINIAGFDRGQRAWCMRRVGEEERERYMRRVRVNERECDRSEQLSLSTRLHLTREAGG